MIRTEDDTLADLAAMEAAITRVREVIYAKSFFRSQYDAALARVEVDLGPCLGMIKLLFPGAEPEDLIDAMRTFVRGREQSRDLPQTAPPEGPR
jgi:hypothetical protein